MPKTKPASSLSLNIHLIANFSWQETCSKWNSWSALLLNSPVSYKKGVPKALVPVYVFKCKIPADIQHGVCTIKATKNFGSFTSLVLPDSLSSLCLLIQSMFNLVVLMQSEEKEEKTPIFPRQERWMGHFLLCAGLKQHFFFFFLISSILEPPVIEKGIGLIMQERSQLC